MGGERVGGERVGGERVLDESDLELIGLLPHLRDLDDNNISDTSGETSRRKSRVLKLFSRRKRLNSVSSPREGKSLDIFS